MQSVQDLKGSTVWECAECGYLIAEVVYKSARYPYPCPRCLAPYQYFTPRVWLVEEKTNEQEIEEKTNE